MEKYPRLLNPNNFKDKIKGYNKLKETYHEYEIFNRNKEGKILSKIKNKKVRYWKLVRISDNFPEEDEYIPIFFKKIIKKKKKV
jgi:hypothetical protein